MEDVLLFIPRLIKDIAIFIWGIITDIASLVSRVFDCFFPISTINNLYSYVGFLVILIVAFVMRKQLGGFFRALLALIIIIFVGVVMVAINPIGAIITFGISILVGFNILKAKNFLYVLMGLMWTGMLIYKVMA